MRFFFTLRLLLLLLLVGERLTMQERATRITRQNFHHLLLVTVKKFSHSWNHLKTLFLDRDWRLTLSLTDKFHLTKRFKFQVYLAIGIFVCQRGVAKKTLQPILPFSNNCKHRESNPTCTLTITPHRHRQSEPCLPPPSFLPNEEISISLASLPITQSLSYQLLSQ